MNDITGEFVKAEMVGAAVTSQKVVSMVMDECSVGRGLLAAAMAYIILAKSAPVDIPLEDLHEIIDSVHHLVSESEGQSRVIQ